MKNAARLIINGGKKSRLTQIDCEYEIWRSVQSDAKFNVILSMVYGRMMDD